MPKPEALHTIVERAASWPQEAQDELTQVALEIEAELSAAAYRPTAAELRGIERGLRDAAEGKFASEAEVEAVFAKHRGE
jgi:predicted transcriptional regulator